MVFSLSMSLRMRQQHRLRFSLLFPKLYLWMLLYFLFRRNMQPASASYQHSLLPAKWRYMLESFSIRSARPRNGRTGRRGLLGAHRRLRLWRALWSASAPPRAAGHLSGRLGQVVKNPRTEIRRQKVNRWDSDGEAGLYKRSKVRYV